MGTQTATEMRRAFISTLRSQSAKKCLTGINERRAEEGVFSEAETEYAGVKIGDLIVYVDTKPHNGGLISIEKQGWLFSSGKRRALVWDGKKLVQVDRELKTCERSRYTIDK